MVTLIVNSRTDKQQYKGGWKAGQRHGKGVFVDKSGKEQKGLWENNRRVR